MDNQFGLTLNSKGQLVTPSGTITGANPYSTNPTGVYQPVGATKPAVPPLLDTGQSSGLNKLYVSGTNI